MHVYKDSSATQEASGIKYNVLVEGLSSIVIVKGTRTRNTPDVLVLFFVARLCVGVSCGGNRSFSFPLFGEFLDEQQ